MRIRRIAGRQASRPLLIGLKVGRMLKRTSGLNKLMSIVHRISMELESKLQNEVHLFCCQDLFVLSQNGCFIPIFHFRLSFFV